MPHQLEARLNQQAFHVFLRARKEIVYAQDIVAFLEQLLA
jgi:hypothetical protein